MNMKEVREAAKAPLKGFCRVCPVCNGKACAGEVPGSGGVGTGMSFMNNVKALEAIQCNLRLIHGATAPDTSCEVLGLKLSFPVMPAPIGGVTHNIVADGPEMTYGMHLAKGCLAAGTVTSLGDGPQPLLLPASMRALEAVQGQAILYLKPWENAELCEKIDAVARTGATVVGTDIDAPGLGAMRKLGRGIVPKSLAQITEVVEHSHKHNLKIVLKGIMTVEDARCALRAGADGIVVSNHGGRVLDHTPGTIEVLPEICAAVKGRMAVLIDGGFRTGLDVLKAIALGADAVLVGRPFMWGVLGGVELGSGEDGVRCVLDTLRDDLEKSMMLTGCATLAEAGPHILRKTGCRTC